MKIVIEIDDARFKDIQRIAEVQLERNHFQTAEQIIANGTPLPKGHGRLIDESQITQVRYHDYISKVDGWQIPHCFIDGTDAPTIIEADTESEDKG